MNTQADISPELWIKQLFSAKAVNKGGVLRRSARDIERFVGRETFVAEIKRRGFKAVENNGQVVIFCNRAPVYALG